MGDLPVDRLPSHEHLWADGTMVDTWALMMDFRRKDGGGGDEPLGLVSNVECHFGAKGARRMLLPWSPTSTSVLTGRPVASPRGSAAWKTCWSKTAMG